MGNAQGKHLTQKRFKQYRKLILKSKEAIVVLDATSKFTLANKYGARFFGVQNRKDITKYTPGFFSPPRQQHLSVESDVAAKEIVKKVFESGTGKVDFIWHHQKLNGELFFAHIFLSMIHVGEESYCQAIMRIVKNPDESQDILSNPIDPKFLNVEVPTTDLDSNSNSSITNTSTTSTTYSQSKEKSTKSNKITPKSSTKSSHKSALNEKQEKQEKQDLQDQQEKQEKKEKEKKKKNIKQEIQEKKEEEEEEKEKEQEEQPEESLNGNSTVSVIVDFGDIEMETEYLNFQEKIKSVVRISKDASIEKKVINEFQKYDDRFYKGLEQRDKYLAKLTQKSNNSRQNEKKRYRELELHLQNKLTELKDEQEKRELLEKQNKQAIKLIQDLQNKYNAQKKTMKKVSTFLAKNVIEKN
ncbi:yeats domain [Anaeramoeba flamelloides]|uniref:Yeats domain n=1 Tax=Anaeramoeba flamelloides TaxID=1746091 RepID=A0ABQ8Y273_9EUKA|nr:yeats domain [Anaeramoeba flamelloides]